jgi:hypothetical protein
MLLLTACSPAAQPTASPATPTTAVTPQPPPTHTPQPGGATTRPVGTPVPRPTEAGPTTTPGAAMDAREDIVITQPKVAAALVSPVHIEGEAEPTFEQNLVIHVLDVDGNVVGSGTAQIQADVGQRGPYSADVPFNVRSEGPGRIIVYSVSARDGNTIHLSSVEVRLKPSGESTPGIADSGSDVEAIVIHSPTLVQNVTSPLTISGEAAPTFEQHLSVLIRDEAGNVIATGSTTIQADAGQRGPFSITLTYEVASAQAGRVVVFDASPRDGGVTHLASVEVKLNP